MSATGRALVAIAAGLALADASIVALALPPLLIELHTTITGVAAIVGVYALVMAVMIVPASRLVTRLGAGRTGAIGLLVFALASLACATVSSLAPLLVFRAGQAAGGALALLAAFELLDAGTTVSGRRLWLAAALVGTAAGPAIGGALTHAFDWRAIFVVQAPLAALAALACSLYTSAPVAVAEPEPEWTPPAPEPRRESGGACGRPVTCRGCGVTSSRRGARWTRWRGSEPWLGGEPVPAARDAFELDEAASLAALGLTAAAFTAVLFLLVIELVAGFALSPLHAALGVTILPVAAVIAASLARGDRTTRAASGALLLAGGAAALAFLPAPGIAWTVVPQVLAGAGMGLSLPAFTTERTLGEAATHLLARHAGIVLLLAILAPVATAKLHSATDKAILQGTSLVLDARIEPLEKLDARAGAARRAQRRAPARLAQGRDHGAPHRLPRRRRRLRRARRRPRRRDRARGPGRVLRPLPDRGGARRAGGAAARPAPGDRRGRRPARADDRRRLRRRGERPTAQAGRDPQPVRAAPAPRTSAASAARSRGRR